MQRAFSEDSPNAPQEADSDLFHSSAQHGLLRPESGAVESRVELNDGDASGDTSTEHTLNADQLDEKLRSLKLDVATTPKRAVIPGQRVSEYENALIATPLGSPSDASGFRVIKTAGASKGVQLPDFPNEVLIQILSHLHPDSHGSVALVSKRFYALITTPYAWRAAFLRYFPGKDALACPPSNGIGNLNDITEDRVQGEFRSFTRLTSLASWRSEYLLRLRLLRSLSRGKPGSGIDGSSRSATSGKKMTAVLTYNSKLPWVITNVHAVFANTKKGPRAIHGTADLGLASVSEPTVGKVEKWGLDDASAASQLQEVFPELQYYGMGDGPAAVPNVMDVSQPYGLVSGEGFPGGRPRFRGTDELRGRYLGSESSIIDMAPEIPKVPELAEAICSVWIAKSSCVPSLTHSMVGIMTGSSLGVVTTYSLGYDALGPRYSNGDMTARWVLSPGVPIIALRVDDNYTLRRKSLKRIWAVALNALGEVFYLSETPAPPGLKGKAEEMSRDAWLAGRTVYWELIESTRRTARPDETGKNELRGAYSPRSPSNAMNLSKEQVMAEAQEIEKFLRHKPSHFRRSCEGWDMRRRLEVDFAAGDDSGTGESIFVITCGHKNSERAGIHRFTRHWAAPKPKENDTPLPALAPEPLRSSLFGGPITPPNSGVSSPQASREIRISILSPPPSTPRLGPALPRETIIDEWQATTFAFKNSGSIEITAIALDMTNFAVLAPFEDPLCVTVGATTTQVDATSTPTSKSSSGEIPGRRARVLAIGTSKGSLVAWNAREHTTADVVSPIRVIQTASPSITSVAISALYLVHGGSDGLVQAWDPLASTLEPVRTLNARFSGRVPTHILNAAPLMPDANFSAVGAIFLDPDPAVLRGVLTCGLWVRYWSYSSANQGPGRKRRLRHSDIHGRLASRRQFGTVSSYIRAEAAELKHEQQQKSREQARLRNRFGVGLGDLTEEEAVRYAQMISEEAFAADEHRRLSASDTGSAADVGEALSCVSSFSSDTVTPEPSVSGASPQKLPPLQEESDDHYEAQIQRAIRLSLMEGVNDQVQSPRNNGSGDYGFQVKVKEDKKKRNQLKGKYSASSSASDSRVHTPVVQRGESSYDVKQPRLSSNQIVDHDEDLELALQLSMVEEQERQNRMGTPNLEVGLGIQEEEYPALEVKGKGKGKYM